MIDWITYTGDCLHIMREMKQACMDMVYCDPPFLTQRVHRSATRAGTSSFHFHDVWRSRDEYSEFLVPRIGAARDVLKDTGSLFFHCDKSAAHIIRAALDHVFGERSFRSEIIWSYKRWSNAKNGLLPAHQTIFFYSKTQNFKFNRLRQQYSPTTNIDQIMQERSRDWRNKAAYKRDIFGQPVTSHNKLGVPLSDVWDIPFLNPKAKERVGFPTQKPVVLMERLINLVTDESDWVLDPFCGSGTTLVAAKLLGRGGVGIDIQEEATTLTKTRLENPVVSDSGVLKEGRDAYWNHDWEAAKFLTGIDYIPIQRNKAIDGLLSARIDGDPVFIRVQRKGEQLQQTVDILKSGTRGKGVCKLLVVATDRHWQQYVRPPRVIVIPSTSAMIHDYLDQKAELMQNRPG